MPLGGLPQRHQTQELQALSPGLEAMDLVRQPEHPTEVEAEKSSWHGDTPHCGGEDQRGGEDGRSDAWIASCGLGKEQVE